MVLNSLSFCLSVKLFDLFLATLDLRCFMRAFSSCREWGYSLVVVHELLLAVASLVSEHGLGSAGFSSCGTWV